MTVSKYSLPSHSSTQLPLPGIGKSDSSLFSDPAFASNKTQPLHRWVPWIAGFSSNFVADALNRFLPTSGTVLDPFAGVGTTLIEALRHGHNAIGFEINPYAALASHVKCSIFQIDAHLLSTQLDALRAFYNDRITSNYQPASSPPEGFQTRAAFYSPSVMTKVLILLDFISDIPDAATRALFKLAFASTMVRYSNYSYEPSLSRRVTAGKDEILDFPVGEEVSAKLQSMREDIVWWQTNVSNDGQTAQVINRSFFKNTPDIVASRSIDLIITSPPYLNNYHYNRNTRPQLYWLGFAETAKDLRELEEANFGKYWQTVRGSKPIALHASLHGTEIEHTIATVRKLYPDKGVYGGSGWANYAASYFNDCVAFALSIREVLKPDAAALVVIGNSILQGVLIPTDRYFGLIAQMVGLKLTAIHIPRETRVGNSIIQSDVRVEKASKSHQLYEAIVELRNVS